MLSQTAEYALRAVLYLGEHTGPVRVGDMAQALQIPRNYLSKILHLLARTGVLASARGKTGGFQLAVPADRLRLHHIIAPFDRIDERRRCLLGRPQCSDRTACAAHTRWKDVADTVASFFRETTVAELLSGAEVSV
ncbi:MAG TPA: Rrf2 family transcriptional regulator [Gemmatimonadales bacterium]|nr:Rrf2 family transcriptional regulator [Gemmatimonadales bacterium]